MEACSLTEVSLNSIYSNIPNSPRKDHTNASTRSDSTFLFPTSVDETNVLQESLEDLVNKIDKVPNGDSYNGTRLFGRWVVPQGSCRPEVGVGFEQDRVCQNQETEKKRTAEDLLESQDSSKPFKKRASASKPNKYRDGFVKKVLTKSDTDHSSRLLLGKIEARQILPHLDLTVEEHLRHKDGEKVKFYDVDIGKQSTLVLKRWKTNSFIFNNGWRLNFVKGRNLHKGDEVQLAWDEAAERFNFSVISRAPQEDN